MIKNLTLSPKKRRAIEALMAGGNPTTAAASAGVSRETIYRWLNEAAFQYELNRLTGETLAMASRALTQLSVEAVRTLREALAKPDPALVPAAAPESAMGDGDQEPAPAAPAKSGVSTLQIRAANIVLGRMAQLNELLLLTGRLNQLEANLQDYREKREEYD